MKALIIDDSPTMRMIVARELREMHCDVREARDGKEGLALLGKDPDLDFILLDWNMPEMNGLEFIKAARANPATRKVPIIMLTTEASEANRKASLEAGANHFLSKPFTWEELLALLNKAPAVAGPDPLIPSAEIQGIVSEVFRVMLKLKAAPRTAPAGRTGTRVTSVVTMSGPPGADPPSYGVVLEMSESLAFKIAGSLAADPVLEWSRLVEDACGEIVNMIAGNAKRHLVSTYVLSLPTVVYGADYHWCMPKLEVRQVERFECSDEVFELLIGQERTAGPL